jgi:drug/metabolite transporter (DMT)-like permease
MTRAYAPLLFLLAAIWGASYLFIKVGVRDFEPSVLVTMRLLIAAVLLIGFLASREGARGAVVQIAGAWREGLIYGVVYAALPFTLITWGETHIDSSIAAFAGSSVPIFVTLLAIRFRPSERSTGAKLAGILVGLAGVGVIAGVHPEGGVWAVVGTLAVVGASDSYAAGRLYGQHHVGRVSGPVIAAAGLVYGGLLVLPAALVQLPDHAPGWKPIGSVLALAVGATAVGQLLVFRMLRLFGAARLSLVTYLMPPAALFYGAVILDEPVRASALAGLALILGGIALGSGLWRPFRRALAEPAP